MMNDMQTLCVRCSNLLWHLKLLDFTVISSPYVSGLSGKEWCWYYESYDACWDVY
jgi:hypothetical protein